MAGKRVELRSSAGAKHGRRGSLAQSVYNGPLLQFRVGATEADETSIPATLRPLPAWVAGAPAQPSRTWTVSIGKGLIPSWQINGKSFDPARVDARPQLGTTETWELRNETAVTHTIHLHHTDWYMLSRNGKPPAPHEDCLKETFLLEPRDRVVIAGRFSDYTGKYVIHCHMLDHEDHGLMTQFEVVA
jgi:FtsP/CotA-like multicopper oxidase with cupredoxin domain